MAIVKTVNLNKAYKTGGVEVHALQDINLEIEAGSLVAIMGPSGSGKSTLLNMIGCLDRPTSGKIFLDSHEVSRLGSGELTRIRRERIGFVFQSFNLIPTLTAVENVMLPLRYEKISHPKMVAEDSLKRLGMGERLNFRPSELSGGEQQRVAIARALVLEPAIVLADEPTGELDSANGEIIMSLIRDLNRNQGQTFIIVTHDPVIASQASRILTMKDGTIQEAASQR